MKQERFGVRWYIAAISAVVLIAAMSLNDCYGAHQSRSAGSDVAVTLVLTQPPAPYGNGAVIPCGSSISGIGDVVATAYGTATQAGTYKMRVSYGKNGSLEAWYDDINQQFPTNTPTMFTQAVQDLEPGSTSFTVNAHQANGTGATCTVNVSNVRVPAEGAKSVRPVISGGFVDQLKIDVQDYKTGAAIPCGTTFHTGRVIETISALSSVARLTSVHTHMERPDTNGPDQDLDPANFRWWEFTTPQAVSVPANVWTAVAQVVANTATGKNVFHAADQSANGTGPQVFCSFTAS